MSYAMVRERLLKCGYTILVSDRIEYGQRLRLVGGPVVTVYDSGSVVVQGKDVASVQRSLTGLTNPSKKKGRKGGCSYAPERLNRQRDDRKLTNLTSSRENL